MSSIRSLFAGLARVAGGGVLGETDGDAGGRTPPLCPRLSQGLWNPLLGVGWGGGRVTFPAVTSCGPWAPFCPGVCPPERRQPQPPQGSRLSLGDADASEGIFKRAAGVAVGPRKLKDPPQIRGPLWTGSRFWSVRVPRGGCHPQPGPVLPWSLPRLQD